VLTVSTFELKAGQVLAAPVAKPDQPDQTLLNRGYVLQDAVIQRIKDLGISYVFVDFPGLDDLDKLLAPQLSPERQNIYNQIKKSIETCQRSTKPSISFNDYYSATRDMICTLMGSGPNPVFMEQIARLAGDAVGHATSVAHLALVLGIKLEGYLIRERSRLSTAHAKETVNLGVAGMLHDIGKTKLPKPLQQRHVASTGALEAAQQREWEEHTRLGYDMIQSGVEATAASAVLHHHQRFDGGGFPMMDIDGAKQAPQGKRIHIFARMLAAADLFDRLCTDARGRRRPNLEVLHLLRTDHAGAIDPMVQRTLAAIAPPFLPGASVGLSDGTRAIVTTVNPTAPYFPGVRRFIDDHKLDERTIALSPAADTPQIESVNGVRITDMLPGCGTPLDVTENPDPVAA
jgi:HD-GYP domain-containing protein (c-di-GMP phosphodiesterase class II)